MTIELYFAFIELLEFFSLIVEISLKGNLIVFVFLFHLNEILNIVQKTKRLLQKFLGSSRLATFVFLVMSVVHYFGSRFGFGPLIEYLLSWRVQGLSQRARVTLEHLLNSANLFQTNLNLYLNIKLTCLYYNNYYNYSTGYSKTISNRCPRRQTLRAIQNVFILPLFFLVQYRSLLKLFSSASHVKKFHMKFQERLLWWTNMCTKNLAKNMVSL